MSTRKGSGNGRTRMPEDLRTLAGRLASRMQDHEEKRGHHRPFPAGKALRLLLASHGYLPKPATREDAARMEEVRRLADAEAAS